MSNLWQNQYFQHPGFNQYSPRPLNNAGGIPNFRIPPPGFIGRVPSPGHESSQHCLLRPRFNIPPPSNMNQPPLDFTPNMHRHTQNEDGQDWISNWSKSFSSDTRKSNKNNVKISDVQKMLVNYLTHLQKLSTLKEDMKSADTNERIEEIMGSINKTKACLSEGANLLKDSSYITLVKQSVDDRRRRRHKRSLKKKKLQKEKSEKMNYIKQKHEAIDKWIESTRMDTQHQLLNERVKKEADSVLSEVKGKQDDLTHMKSLLENLITLRKVRLQNAETRGIVSTSDEKKFFDAQIDKLRSVIDKQEEEYRLEEATLRVMMEDAPKSFVKMPKQDLKNIQEQLIYILMGSDETDDCYSQSDQSIENLIVIRKGWDHYISDDVTSSSVPLGWVIPPDNSTDEWRKYQQNN